MTLVIFTCQFVNIKTYLNKVTTFMVQQVYPKNVFSLIFVSICKNVFKEIIHKAKFPDNSHFFFLFSYCAYLVCHLISILLTCSILNSHNDKMKPFFFWWWLGGLARSQQCLVISASECFLLFCTNYFHFYWPYVYIYLKLDINRLRLIDR